MLTDPRTRKTRADDRDQTPREDGEGRVVGVEEFDAAFDAYLDDVPPREQVPSLREVENGIRTHTFRPEPPPPQVRRRRLASIMFGQFRQLNPRSIAAGGAPVLPLVVIGAFSVQGSGTFDDLAFNSLVPLIRADMGFDFAALLTLVGVVQTILVISAPMAGYLADRVSRVWLVRIGTLIDSLGGLLAGLAGSPAMLFASRTIAACGPGLFAPAAQPLLADYYVVERRARVFGFTQLFTFLLTVVLSIVLSLGVYSFGWFSWRPVLIVGGVVGLAFSLLTFRLKEPVRGASDRISAGVPPDQAQLEQKPPSWGEAWRTCASIGTLRKLWWATPFMTLAQTGMGYFMLYVILAESITQKPSGIMTLIAPIYPVLAFTVPVGLAILLIPVGVHLSDRLLRHRPGRIMFWVGVVQCITAATAIAIIISPDLFIAVVMGWIGAAAAQLIGPAQSLLLSVVVPARIRGIGMQTVAPFRLLGLALLPFLGGVADIYGPKAAIAVMVPVLLVGAVILMTSGVNVARDMRNAVAASVADREAKKAKSAGATKMIVMREVDVFYGGAQVLQDVSLDVGEGELIAVLGTNGAGKSTLLKAIAGIHAPTEGAIFLDGEDITHKPAHLNAREGIVFLPGGRAIFPSLSVAENLRTATWVSRKVDEKEMAARRERVLELFPVLVERMQDQAGNLSGGEQQMLALAQCFLMSPRLLMIDELSLGLAPRVVDQLLEIVRGIHANGTTVILVEQSINVALTIAERSVFLDRGRIHFDGPTAQLLGRGDLVRAVFLGGTGGAPLTVGPRRDVTRAHRDDDTAEALEAADITLQYGGVAALNGVSLQVGGGEVVGIIGPNGAGKTSLFDVISGFARPTTGRIWVGGFEVTGSLPEERAAAGLARSFQNSRLFAALTVRDTVAVALDRHAKGSNALLAATWAPVTRRSERRLYRRADHLLGMLGLGVFADKFVNELSTGSRRMVDLACALATEPKLLLLDEPSSGMAQAEVEMLGPVVRHFAEQSGAGVLVIEHDMPLVTGMSDRLVAMELGRVILAGPPDAVVRDPRVVASYLGASDAAIRRSGSVWRHAAAALDVAQQ